MLTRIFTIAILATAVVFGAPVWSYDSGLADSYANLFAPVKGKAAGKALHLMKPEAFLNKVKANEPLVVLDVNTPAESGVFTSSLPGTMLLPINELFSKDNLSRIPKDKTVVVLCKSGTRATAAGIALQHIGFENVYILKGGFKALVGYMGPKEANTPPSKGAKSK
jgi:rhodanese-related sulfurtransferase